MKPGNLLEPNAGNDPLMISSGPALFISAIASVATWVLASLKLHVIIEGGWIRNLRQRNNARRMSADAQTARRVAHQISR